MVMPAGSRSREAVRDEIKAALADPATACERLGISLEGAQRQARGLLVRCPCHADAKASLSVIVGESGTLQAVCQAGCFRGDVFNLVAAIEQLDVKRDFPRVLKRAAEAAGVALDESPARPAFAAPRVVRPAIVPSAQAPLIAPPSPAPAEDLTAIWDGLPAVDPDCWEYLKGRGLSDAGDLCRSPADDSPGQLGRLAREGYRLAVALRDQAGRVVAIQVRQIVGKDFRMVGPSNAGVFGDPRRLAEAETVVLCEGLSDSLAAAVALKGEPSMLTLGVPGVKASAGFLQLALAGKRVVVASDADQAGDEFAREIIPLLEKRKARPVRARPAKAKDLAEMLSAGRSLPAFFRLALATEPRFASFAERIRSEREDRLEQTSRFCPWGVGFLDKALGPILPKDLVLIGAKSGRGKTDLARIVAMTNAYEGKKSVHYFALEGERNEIERRAKYAQLAEFMVSRVPSEQFARMNYLEWYLGRLDGLTAPYEAAVDETLGEKFRTLHTFYRGRDFTVDTLERKILEIQDETDLIIVDHLHYIDTRDDEDEYRGQKAMMKRIRDLQDGIGRPVVLIAQLRKEATQKASRTLLPELDDFQGSSDLGKIATKAVLLAPALEHTPTAAYRAPTFIGAQKCRVDGSRTRYAAVAEFNFRTSRYEDDFTPGRMTKGGTAFEPLAREQWPQWLKHR